MEILIGLLSFAAVYVFWEVTCIFVLRAFGIRIPLVFLLHFHPLHERDLVESMQGRTRAIHILVSGFLFFACPLFLGLMAYDRMTPVNGLYNPGYYVGSAVLWVILAAGGMFIGRRTWEKSRLDFEHISEKER